MSQSAQSILICAYACDPTKGSEPGGGWEWALELSKHRKITLITRAKNRQNIEAALERLPAEASRPEFQYFDLPKALRKIKKGEFGASWYYYLWQLALGLKLRRQKACRLFGFAHHLTFGAAWRPSALALAGIPFLLGPVGGAELIPLSAWPVLGFKEATFEALRRIILAISFTFDPFVILTLKRAAKILATSSDTKKNLPAYVQKKCDVFPQFGICTQPHSASGLPIPSPDRLQILYAGRPYRRKGAFLALSAFQEHRKKFPASTLTILCPPPYGEMIEHVLTADERKNLTIISAFVSREEIGGIYARHEVFLYPSLRDAWGRVILEAMAEGLSPIVLSSGGPAEIVTPESGFLVNTSSRKKMEADLASCLNRLAEFPEKRQALAQAARQRMREVFSWEELARHMLAYYPDPQYL